MIIINVYEAFVTAGYCAEYFICEINCSGLKHKHITLALSIIFHTWIYILGPPSTDNGN